MAGTPLEQIFSPQQPAGGPQRMPTGYQSYQGVNGGRETIGNPHAPQGQTDPVRYGQYELPQSLPPVQREVPRGRGLIGGMLQPGGYETDPTATQLRDLQYNMLRERVRKETGAEDAARQGAEARVGLARQVTGAGGGPSPLSPEYGQAPQLGMGAIDLGTIVGQVAGMDIAPEEKVKLIDQYSAYAREDQKQAWERAKFNQQQGTAQGQLDVQRQAEARQGRGQAFDEYKFGRQQGLEERKFSAQEARTATRAPTDEERKFLPEGTAFLIDGMPYGKNGTILAQKPASTQVTTNVLPGEKAEDAERGKLAAQDEKTFMDSARTAPDTRYRIQTARALLEEMNTGPLAPRLQTVQGVLQEFGLPANWIPGLKPNQATNAGAVETIVNRMLIDETGGLGRQISDGDRAFYERMYPNARHLPGANMMALDMMEAAQARKEAAYSEWIAFRRYQKGQGREPRWNDFQDQFFERYKDKDAFGEVRAKYEAGAYGDPNTPRPNGGGGAEPPVVNDPAEARKLPPGTEFVTPDGRRMRVPGG